MSRLLRIVGILSFTLISSVFLASKAEAALPANFQATPIITSGLNGPSGFGIAPDGRIFILERTGAIKIYKGGQLLPTPFATLPSAATGDRGLIGVAFDPDFTTNHFVYFYYTAAEDILNRLVRFDASGDVALEPPVQIYQTHTPSQFLHSGGSVVFGPDGKIYLAIGDNGYPPNAQDLSNAHGKILRINKDGGIPDDNPFIGTPGALPEIWAYGFRNPWRFKFDSLSGKMYGGDVGESSVEELNEIKRGMNYGWPICEGYCTQYTQPLYAYAHSGPSSAVTAGPVYRGSMFPSDYNGSFFFADYGQGFIKRALFDDAGAISSVEDFDIGAGSVVDLHTANDGSLYYITYYPGRLYRINYSTGNHIPVANSSSDVTSGTDPLTVHFTSLGSFDPDGDTLSYLWNFGNGVTSTVANPVHTFNIAGVYVVELTVSDGQAQTIAVPIVIQVGLEPTVTIGLPLNNSTYKAGDTIFYSGHGLDGAGFDLPDSAFTTEVRFHHHDHIHPFLGPVPGKNGSFSIPTTGEPDPDTWYEIRITATDINGLTNTAIANIHPKTSTITFVTNPAGLDIDLDGSPVHTPVTVLGVVGFNRLINAPAQGHHNNYYVFDSWSDAGPASHFITFPDTDTTVTANFVVGTSECNNVGVNAFIGCYHSGKTLSDLRLIRTDPQINFNWAANAPGLGLPIDDFSVRWSGDFEFVAGEYDFTTQMDDGVKVYIDGVLTQDYWIEQSAVPHTSHVSLTAGVHNIIVEYFEAGGDASAKFTWVRTGDIIPVVTCEVPIANAFNACYYYPANFADFKLQRSDAYPINFDFGLGSPDPLVPVDTFSASWVGNFSFETSEYTFTVTADDGIRLLVDGNIVLDKFFDQPPTTYTVKLNMVAGVHTIKLLYYENYWQAVAKLSWVKTSILPPDPVTNCEVAQVNAFKACYFNNADFTNWKLARTDTTINFDWGQDSPDPLVEPETFSASWLGTFTFNTGTYEFVATADDGIKVFVDGQVIIDQFHDQPATTYTVRIELTAGQHVIKVLYFDNYWNAVSKLGWNQVGSPPPPPVLNCATPGLNSFTGCYYDNKDFTNLKLVKTDTAINFDYGAESPDPVIGREEFSIRWSGDFNLVAGNYIFTTRSDDGVRLYIDDVLVIDKWINQGATSYTAPVTITSGTHNIRLEYYENWGDASVSLVWVKQ